MQRLLILALTASLALAPTAPAFAASEQNVTDHWKTRVECEAATNAPYYTPSTTSSKALGKDEVILPHPTGGCFEIDLPDRLTERFPVRGRGWVRLAPGTEMVYNTINKSVVRVAKCDNGVYAEAPFGNGSVASNPFTHVEKTEVPAPAPPAPAPATPSTLGRSDKPLILPAQIPDATRRYDDDKSFMDRHGKKLVTAGAIAGGLALLALFFGQRTTVIQCVGSPDCP